MSYEVYTVVPELDASSSKKEQEGIMEILDNGNSVILDLSNCTYVSSAGLRVLLYTYKVAASKKLSLYLVGASSNVKEVMSMTGFDRFFKYFDTVEACKQVFE